MIHRRSFLTGAGALAAAMTLPVGRAFAAAAEAPMATRPAISKGKLPAKAQSKAKIP
jgi:hypothetical protein